MSKELMDKYPGMSIKEIAAAENKPNRKKGIKSKAQKDSARKENFIEGVENEREDNHNPMQAL